MSVFRQQVKSRRNPSSSCSCLQSTRNDDTSAPGVMTLTMKLSRILGNFSPHLSDPLPDPTRVPAPTVTAAAVPPPAGPVSRHHRQSTTHPTSPHPSDSRVRLPPGPWPLITLCILLSIIASPASCFAIQGPSFLAKRTSVPYEGLRSKPGLFSFERPYARPSTHRPQPESKFRDAISGYSVDLDEDEASRLLKSKLSLYSSSLNVLDGHPEDTELAHSILLVHKRKPSAGSTSPPAPPSSSSPHNQSATLFSSSSSLSPSDALSSTLDIQEEEPASPSLASSLSYFTTSIRTTTTTSTTSSTPKPPSTVKFSAHTFKPFAVSSSLSYASPSASSPLKFKNKPSSGTFLFGNFTQVSSFDPNYVRPSFVSNNHRPGSSSSFSRLPTKRRPVFAPTTASSIDRIGSDDDDEPVVVHSNHRKTFLMRHKLTSEHADPWTTPTTFTEFAHRTQTTPSPQTFYPPYTSTVTTRQPVVSTPTSFVSVHSRPPLKVTAVHSNRHKNPESVASNPMMVLDSNANVTIMHQKLIVPYKPGRPKPAVSSIGTILTANSPVRTKPNTTDGGDAIDDKNDAELTTYYPQSLFKPTTQYPGPCRECPWTMETEMTTYPSSTPFVTISTTTKDPFVADSSSHVIVTKRPPYPAATVNAILAPPMPSRPISTPAPIGNTGIFSSLMGVLGVDSTGGLMSRLTLLKTALFTLLVMFLPPLTLAAAVAQLL